MKIVRLIKKFLWDDEAKETYDDLERIVSQFKRISSILDKPLELYSES